MKIDGTRRQYARCEELCIYAKKRRIQSGQERKKKGKGREEGRRKEKEKVKRLNDWRGKERSSGA